MAHRIIISGGGTGGHIFPAISIANALRRLDPTVEILFVGAKGKMEMEKVPAAGYEIVGLNIRGIDRSSLLNNIMLPFQLIASMLKARKVIKNFGAQVAVGVGGYASAPLLMVAGNMEIPTLIQEQNSYAGVTNKRLANKASRICVAYEGMEQFFPADKVMLTGNPVRRASVDIIGLREEALSFFGLAADRKTILITGGSQGAGTLNNCMIGSLLALGTDDVQVIWQCGEYYYDSLKEHLAEVMPSNVLLMPFLQRMDYAYAAADLIISRAGAGTISELCVIGKPVVLVPSPNVAEDHQTKNAKALVDKDAAVLVKDNEAERDLIATAMQILRNDEQSKLLGENIKKMARLDADEVIAREVLKLIK